MTSKQKYDASDIVPLIEILEDAGLPQEVKLAAAQCLTRICSSESEIVGGKEELRSFFTRTLDDWEDTVLNRARLATELADAVVDALDNEGKEMAHK